MWTCARVAWRDARRRAPPDACGLMLRITKATIGNSRPEGVYRRLWGVKRGTQRGKTVKLFGFGRGAGEAVAVHGQRFTPPREGREKGQVALPTLRLGTKHHPALDAAVVG